jgi:excisionase family DNA binding protein
MKKTKEDWTARNEKKTDKNALRSKDVAHILDCSPDDVIHFARKGKLEAYKVGRLWRFKMKDVLNFQKQSQ